MSKENRPPGAEDAGTGTLKSHQPDFTSIRQRVKRKTARPITSAAREAINVLYGPPESHDREDDESKLNDVAPRDDQSGAVDV